MGHAGGYDFANIVGETVWTDERRKFLNFKYYFMNHLVEEMHGTIYTFETQFNVV